MIKIAIIGAGFTGLTIANLLKYHAQITLFEKSRGTGGRIATRYANEWEFDHGTPFFTATNPQFMEFLTPLLANNVIAKWNIRFAPNNLHPKIDTPPSGNDYFTGIPKMNSIGKYLAQGLDIKLETKIISLSHTSGKWHLTDDKSHTYEGFDFVITTTPPLQAADILPPHCSYIKDLQSFNMLPAFAVMLGFDTHATQDWDIAYVKNSKIKLISINHHKPSRNTKDSFVIITDHNWSKLNIDTDKNDIASSILMELEDILGQKPNPVITQVHRWLYAQAQSYPSMKPFFIDQENNLISCGDWCIGNNIESAFQSAVAVVSCIQHSSHFH